MGPKKEMKKGVTKLENGVGACNIEEPINTESWKCAVVMAVEKTYFDTFILKEFMKESLNRRRQEVSLIDFDTLVMEILSDFANGELPYKYAFLLNFSSVFQEAVNYFTQKMELPILVLVKVVKALLFYLREESLAKIKKVKAGLPDPIKAMAERQTNFGPAETKKKEVSKIGDSRVKVRPPSVTKEDTELLKRGEGAKYDQRIDDAPPNAYFNLYVLLTGFYKSSFPLELIKAGIPLHGLICIDSSIFGVSQSPSSSLTRFQKRNSEAKSQEIDIFWADFLKMLWDPTVTFYFKDTIFQVYTPQKFLCNKKKLREFIYREISYLMYDLSDLKRQLDNYLAHMKLWNVSVKESEIFEAPLQPDNLPGDCVSVPVVLYYVIDAIAKAEKDSQRSPSTEKSGNLKAEDFDEFPKCLCADLEVGTCPVERSWTRDLEERGDLHLLIAYLKTKELDLKYELNDKSVSADDSVKAFTESDSIQTACNFHPHMCGENMEEALLLSDGVFGSYWKKYEKYVKITYKVDYCLYALFMTKVFCSYKAESKISPARSYSTAKKNSNFENIENVSEEMRKPHFTVTEGSRSILRSVPYNVKSISRDFFCPKQYKIVSPEKLKATSALEFRVTPSLRVQTLFTSEVFSGEILKNPFEKLRGFVDESLFSNTNDFDFVEFLSKPKLLEKEQNYWNSYNCIDHSYSFLDDTIFLMLHNKKDGQNVYHETFNEALKTAVGLRDFYEYVMEDESEWLAVQEELHEIAEFLANKTLENNNLGNVSDSEFWLVESLKYQNLGRTYRKAEAGQEVVAEYLSEDKLINNIKLKNLKKLLMKEEFEGYDVSDMAVQFSGLKTVYYSNDCSVTVQLIEKLYGDQDLGVHVTAASHTLHLYSYVCPEPHILDPFTFHISYKNGIVVAFGRRFVETIEEIEETVEPKTTLSEKKNSLDLFKPVIKKKVSKMVQDYEYLYDMAASLPNGLFIQTIRKVVKPCYIKQHYLVKTEETAKLEKSRLFLPNGNVVKMMVNGTVEILKTDASIVRANLSDLLYDEETGNLNLTKSEVVSGEGYNRVFEGEKMISSRRYQIFQNTDLETNQVYFRRIDGTNYMLQDDGVLCVQFKDGTRISSSMLLQMQSQYSFNSSVENESPQETDLNDEFVIVHLEIIVEHQDYVTVIFNTLTQKWRILFPFNSKITVEPEGCYSVDIDELTELKVQANLVEMKRFSSDWQPECTFTADLSVFENAEVTTYCRVKDLTGKTFTVEGNSNCYIVSDETDSQEDKFREEVQEEIQSQESERSELVASTDLQTCSLIQTNQSSKLSRENKYFVIKRDVTGVELLHKDDVKKELSRDQKGSLVFTLNIPDSENRCFVLITPKAKKKMKKWEVETILPDPKYQPNAKPKTTSSTHGFPPSWMHPFPKKKTKFIIPQILTCRVFVETKRTDLSPNTGAIDSGYCEIEEMNQMKCSQIPPKEIEEFLRKLSNDDQGMLREMYTLAVASLINEKKKLKPVNSEKLEHYLKMSRYYVKLRGYHKKCIRYHIVPNYFNHPAGMSWVILSDLLLKLKSPDKQTETEIQVEGIASSDQLLPSSKASGFSNEEIEYNLSLSGGYSFSDLSFHSNLSARTAPAILKTGGVCRCKVKPGTGSVSSPIIKFYSREQIFSDANFEKSQIKVCNFEEKDIEQIEKKDYGGRKTLCVSLEELMNLGLV